MRHNHSKGEKQYAIELVRFELIHDIEFESWKISKTRIDDVTMQEKLQADFQADDWIERQIEQAVDDIYGELSHCLLDYTRAMRDTLDVTPVYNENNFPYEEEINPDELMKKPERYTFSFLLPKEWNGMLRSVRTNLHRYVVYTVLARWFELVKPDEVAAYQAKALDAMNSLKSDTRCDYCNVTFIL